MTDNRSSTGSENPFFQRRVVEWLMACFSNEVCRDGIERNHRFLEEALELVQSLECTRSEAHQLVDYVFDRPVGEPMQELGGSLVTLVALANCHDMDVMEAGETELARVWTKIDKIRAKQAAKPKHSPLPQHVDAAQEKSGCGESDRPSLSNARPVSDFATGRVPEFLEPARPTQGGDKGEAVAWQYKHESNGDDGWCMLKGGLDPTEFLKQWPGIKYDIRPLYATPQPASNAYSSQQPETTRNLVESICDDCPPVCYPTDKTRCTPCPRRTTEIPSTNSGDAA